MSVKPPLAAGREEHPVGPRYGRFPSPGLSWAKSPDVVVTGFREVSLLEAQTHEAASWLSARYQTEMGSVLDQLLTNSCDRNRIIRELQAAGFSVLAYHQD